MLYKQALSQMRHFCDVLQFTSIAKLERYDLAAEAVLSENNIYLFIITQELRIIYFTKDEIQMLFYIKM